MSEGLKEVGQISGAESVKGAVLAHLRKVAIAERGEAVYAVNRDALAYLLGFGGLTESFKYIKQLKSNVVVDIGTGKGLAWSELAGKYGNGLEFWATNLVYDKHLVDLFNDRVKFTPVEFMKGFTDESVGGVIAMKSIAYSASPEMAMRAIDRILVPGGLIKASFRGPEESGIVDLGYQTHHKFTESLKSLGYDIGVLGDEVVLAVKPGGGVKAKDILTKDLESVEQKPFV